MKVVHQDKEDNLWYFWDESWAYRYGPYDSEKEAYERLRKYCNEVLNKNERIAPIIVDYADLLETTSKEFQHK